MTGRDYEFAVARYLQKCGFTNVSVTKASGDQGADLIAYKGGCKYAVQCKYYSKPVDNKAVQEVLAGKAYYGCNGAMVVTNQTFTKSAVELAQRAGVFLYSHADVKPSTVPPKQTTKQHSSQQKTAQPGLHPLLCCLISYFAVIFFSNITGLHFSSAVLFFGAIIALAAALHRLSKLTLQKPPSPTPTCPTYDRSRDWGALSSGEEPFFLPAGRYQVGVDIPIGAYRLTCPSMACRLRLITQGQQTERDLEADSNWCLTAQHGALLEVSEPGVVIKRVSAVRTM